MRIILIIILIFSLNVELNAQEKNEDCKFDVSKKSRKLYKKAMEALRIGHKLEGTKYLQRSIEESPEYLRALWVLADLNNRSTNRYRKEEIAISSYKQIIDLCPSFKDYYSYYKLGKLYYNKEEYGEAHKYLELFIKADNEKIHEKHIEDAIDLSKYAKFYHEIYSKPVPFDPQLVSDVSSSEDEYLASLSPDNEYLYFTRRKKLKKNPRVRTYGNAPTKEEKFCSARVKSGLDFELGSPMEAPFNLQSNEGGATLTIDNKELFYTRCVMKQDNTLNCDINYSKYENGQWSDIVVLDDNINTPDYWESMPSISSDGKTMYFVSNRDGGYGGHDIYRSTRGADGKWSKAVNMGPSINTAGNEKSPFIHTDSQTLYFSSADRYDRKSGEYFAGHIGLGGYDIFYTRLDSNSKWIAPINIGYPINSKNNDLGFSVSTDGEHGFFASNKIGVKEETISRYEQSSRKPKAPWNIYTFKLYKKARPQKVLFVKGNLKDEETGEVVRDATIEIKNMTTKKVKKVKVDNNTGKYVFTMVMKSDYTMTVKKRDYTYVTKYISKTNTRFDVPVNMNLEMKPIKVGKTYNLDDIYFATDSDQLTASSKKVIEGFFEFLNDNPNVIVEIQGHTDNVGSGDYNLKLSKDRAKTVYNLLSQKGISARQMKYKGYGETKPVADNNTEEGRAKNRRTVFLILGK